MMIANPVVTYRVYIDGDIRGTFAGTKQGLSEARDEARETSCHEHAIYRYVGEQRGKCLERRTESGDGTGCYGNW